MPEENLENNKTENKKPKSPNKVWIIVSILLLLILIGLGIYGYTVISNDNKKIEDQQAEINDLQNKKKALEDAASAATAKAVNKATDNYLEVKELGFKLPLNDDIKDLQYFVNDKTAFFSTQSLQSVAWSYYINNTSTATNSSLCSIGSRPLGVISKFANASDAGPTLQKSLNGFVLGYAGPQSVCSNSKAAEDLQTKQRSALESAFNNAEKI